MNTSSRTTIYLDSKIKRSVQYYALRDDRSLSAIINEKLLEYLEDMADIAAIKEAYADNEEFVPLEQVIKELGLDLNEIHRKAKAERPETAKKNRRKAS